MVESLRQASAPPRGDAATTAKAAQARVVQGVLHRLSELPVDFDQLTSRYQGKRVWVLDRNKICKWVMIAQELEKIQPCLDEGTNGQADHAKQDHHRDLEAATLLLKHLVNQVDPGRDNVLYGVVGVPAQATVKNKQAIIDCAREVLDSVMVVSEPFSVAYGLERITDVLVLDIGAGTTDLCRMHGKVPANENQLSLEIAGDAIDEKLYELIMAEYPQAQLTVNMCKEMKEQYGFVRDATDKIEVPIPVDGKPVLHDVTAQLNQACSIIIEPILKGIHKLVASFNPEFQERLRHNIILSGKRCRRLGTVKTNWRWGTSSQTSRAMCSAIRSVRFW